MTPLAQWEATNLAGAHWTDRQGRRRGFAAARPGFGIRHTTGYFATTNGDQPASWTRKSTAAVHAQYPSPNFTFILVTLP